MVATRHRQNPEYQRLNGIVQLRLKEQASAIGDPVAYRVASERVQDAVCALNGVDPELPDRGAGPFRVGF